MKLEHAHLDKLWAEFSVEDDKEMSRKLFKKFSKNLLKHIKLEDDILLPILNNKLVIEKETGPSAVSYHDHTNLVKLLQKLETALGSNDKKLLEYTKTHFKNALGKHLGREDQMNYPLFDTFISLEDWKKIINMLPLTKKEMIVLSRLNTPFKIQDYLDSISFNYERKGETCMSPKRVLKEKTAHCIEGALLAATALWINGEKPLIVNLKVLSKYDYDHIITLYKKNGYWGAISKTNHSVLRFRDPIYRNIHELVISYFHEYFLPANGKKTLVGYTSPINLKKFGTKWIEREDDLWDIAEKIYDSPIIKIIPDKNKAFIRKASPTERKGANIKEWK